MERQFVNIDQIHDQQEQQVIDEELCETQKILEEAMDSDELPSEKIRKQDQPIEF